MSKQQKEVGPTLAGGWLGNVAMFGTTSANNLSFWYGSILGWPLANRQPSALFPAFYKYQPDMGQWKDCQPFGSLGQTSSSRSFANHSATCLRASTIGDLLNICFCLSSHTETTEFCFCRFIQKFQILYIMRTITAIPLSVHVAPFWHVHFATTTLLTPSIPSRSALPQQ